MVFIVTGLIIVGFVIAIICTRFVHKLIVIKRLTQLFGYPINDESYSSLNKEYFDKLSEHDMNQTTADDFELDKIYNLMNRTYSDVGREYMYAQLFTKEHHHELLESIIDQLASEKIFKSALYELYCLSKTYSESLELFDDLTFLSSFDMLIVIMTSLFPFLLIGLSFIYGLQVFQYLYIWLAIQGMLYAHYTKKTDHAMSKALSYCYLVTTLDHLNNLHIYPKEESKRIRQMSHQALRYTYINKICDFIASIDAFYLMELIKGIFSLPIYQCYLLLKHKDELKKSYLEMYEYVGMVDMAISIMSIRQSYQTCIPQQLHLV